MPTRLCLSCLVMIVLFPLAGARVHGRLMERSISSEAVDAFRLFLPNVPFDISTARQPALAGTLTGVAVQDHMAYLQFGGAALVVVDVSEPSRPREVGRMSLAACPGGRGRTVATAARVVVLCTTGNEPDRPDRVESTLLSFRSAGKSMPAPESTTMIHDITFDVAVSASMAHLPTVGFEPTGDLRLKLSAIDLSPSRSAQPKGYLDIGLFGLHLAVAGQAGVVFGYHLAGTALQFLDLTEHTSPRLAGRLKLPDTEKSWHRLSSLAMWGSVVYGFQSGGLMVVDARDIDHPVTVTAEGHDFGDCDGFLSVGAERLAVLTRGCRDGTEALYVFSHWMPSDQPGRGVGPKLLSTLPLQTKGQYGEYDHPLALEGRNIFITDESGWASGRPRSLIVVDISEPDEARAVGRIDFPR